MLRMLILLVITGALLCAATSAHAATGSLMYQTKRVGVASARVTISGNTARLQDVKVRTSGFVGSGSYEIAAHVTLLCRLDGLSRIYPYEVSGRMLSKRLLLSATETILLPSVRAVCPGRDVRVGARCSVQVRPLLSFTIATALLCG